MSLPPNTLWYNGDWNVPFVGISPDPPSECPCDTVTPDEALKFEECISRPPNQLAEMVLLATYSDFDVTDALGWVVTGLFSDNFTALPLNVIMTQITTATWEIRLGVSANNPGTLIASGVSPVTVVATGRSVISDSVLYTEYRFIVSGLSIPLSFNKYHMNVAPIVPPQVLIDAGSEFVLFNSTTNGDNAVGVPAGDNANDFVVVGTPMPAFFIPSTNFGPEYHDFSNGVIGFLIPICIDPDMEVSLQDNTLVRIKDLQPGALLKTMDENKPAKLIINYRNDVPNEVLIHIKPDAIEAGVPNKTLVITSNHPILVNGEYRKPKSLINRDTVFKKKYKQPVHTHTLVTDTGRPVMINGVAVATWKIKKWKR